MKVADHRLVDEQNQPITFRPSPNKGGELKPQFLIMHYTASASAESAISWLCNPQASASAHVVISRDGQVTQLVPFNVVAWHAGKSTWRDGSKTLVGLNDYSIGIELDNPGKLVRQGDHWYATALGRSYAANEGIRAVHKNERRASGWGVYPEVQLEAAFQVASALRKEYGLRAVLGHDDIAPGRKFDPGPAFPMQAFASRLFGRAESAESPRSTTTTTVNLRKGPGTQHAILTKLPPDTIVEVLDREGSWCQVDVTQPVDGTNDWQGWVHGKYLQAVD